MTASLRPYVTAGVALVGAGLVAVAPVAETPAVAFHAVQLTAGGTSDGLVGLVVGGSAIPIPQIDGNYLELANDLFVQRVLPGAVSHGVFTPEGLSPIYSGVKSLPLDTSVTQGRTMLDTDVTNAVNAGNTVAVFGQSQSSTIEGFVMSDLAKAGVPADAVKFVLEGDPSNPDGGLLERFAGLSLPSLGITFSGATPADSIYDTSIYSLEYDGFADFPKYPLNFLADLNAFLGIMYVHGQYLHLDPSDLDAAIKLPTAPGYDGNTTYYMMPTQELPLLQPLRGIPVVGNAVADLLQPDLKLLVNLGYDNPNPNDGWDVGQANVPTEFGLFPSLDQITNVLKAMPAATEQGVQAFMSDLSHPASVTDAVSSTTAPADPPATPTELINALTSSFSQAYSTLLPTTDILTAIGVTLPTYDASLFADHLADPINAVGLPIAADTALVTLAAGIEFMTIDETIQSIVSELTGTPLPPLI